MNTSSTRSTTARNHPDNKAHELIELWIYAEPEAQDESLARLIAATLHDGPGSALEQFAATGTLEAQNALEELNRVRVPLEREAWVDALGRYILAQGGRP